MWKFFGGIISGIVNAIFRRNPRKENRSDFAMVTDRWEDLAERYDKWIISLESKVEDLEQRLEDEEKQSAMMERELAISRELERKCEKTLKRYRHGMIVLGQKVKQLEVNQNPPEN